MAVKLLLAIPNYRDHVAGKFLDSFVRLMAHLTRKFGPGEMQYMRIGLMYIDIARMQVWNHARDIGAENLLFIDDDMTFTPELFETVWNTPADVVSALAFVRREPPTFPAMYRRAEDGSYKPILSYPQNTILPVDGVGMAFTLIRRPVIEALRAPYVRDSSKGEDIIFCERAKAAGFSVVVNTAAKCGHLYTYPFEINEANAGGAVEDLYRSLDPAAPPPANGFPRPE